MLAPSAGRGPQKTYTADELTALVAQGIVRARDTGFHEMLTRFFLWVICRFLEAADADTAPERLVDELVAHWGDARLPLVYYSRECLVSWEARIGWVAPDLRPLAWPPPLTGAAGAP